MSLISGRKYIRKKLNFYISSHVGWYSPFLAVFKHAPFHACLAPMVGIMCVQAWEQSHDDVSYCMLYMLCDTILRYGRQWSSSKETMTLLTSNILNVCDSLLLKILMNCQRLFLFLLWLAYWFPDNFPPDNPHCDSSPRALCPQGNFPPYNSQPRQFPLRSIPDFKVGDWGSCLRVH